MILVSIYLQQGVVTGKGIKGCTKRACCAMWNSVAKGVESEELWKKWKFKSYNGQKVVELRNVMFVGRPSQCFYSMIQDSLTHGILMCMVFVHGFWPILILGLFGLLWREWGYVAINAHLPCIYEGRNNHVLDQFRWNSIVKVKMEGIMVGL